MCRCWLYYIMSTCYIILIRLRWLIKIQRNIYGQVQFWLIRDWFKQGIFMCFKIPILERMYVSGTRDISILLIKLKNHQAHFLQRGIKHFWHWQHPLSPKRVESEDVARARYGYKTFSEFMSPFAPKVAWQCFVVSRKVDVLTWECWFYKYLLHNIDSCRIIDWFAEILWSSSNYGQVQFSLMNDCCKPKILFCEFKHSCSGVKTCSGGTRLACKI